MSDLEFDCPKCGHGLVVDLRGAGRTVNCPECHEAIEIPVPTEDTIDAIEVDEPAAAFQASPYRQLSGLAVSSLVFGILGVAVCFCPLFSIPAMFLGHAGRTAIRNSRGALTGDGMALAGLVLGYVGVGLFVMALLLTAVGLVIFRTVSNAAGGV